MKTIFVVIILFIAILTNSGCATILKGYEDTVRLHNVSDSLQIFNKEGLEIPIIQSTVKLNYVVAKRYDIKLRSNQNHTLIFKNQTEEFTIIVYPKIGFGWILLDLLCGGLPSFYDAYTGNWNRFSDITVPNSKK